MRISEEGLQRLARVPVIRRARGHRLYTQDGRRIIDCYLDGGRSITGHKPGHLIRDLKNDLERGMLTALPSSRLEHASKSVGSIVPGRSVRFYGSYDSALAAAAGSGDPESGTTLVLDPAIQALDQHQNHQVVLWRPKLGTDFPAHTNEVPAVLPILPTSALVTAQAVLFLDPAAPAGEVIPSVALTAFISGVSSLSSLSSDHVVPLPGTRQVGIYFTWNGLVAGYDSLFDWFLKHDVLLSPEATIPSVFPMGLSEGELKRFVRLFRDFAEHR